MRLISICFPTTHCRCIQECAEGDLSDESRSLLMSRDCHLDDISKDKVILCCSNRTATIINSKMLSENSNELKSYKSHDTDRHSPLLRKFTAAETTLYLKKGAPVILTANLTGDLTNGTRGTVARMDKDAIVINVDGVEHSIRRYKFGISTYSRSVCRTQYPLKLAYAITVHRSQGLTLPSIHIDCQDLFLPQQLYVALSRVSKLAHVTISNLDLDVIEPCNPTVLAFLAGEEIQVF